MSPIIEAEYRRGLRELVQAKGVPVHIISSERANWPDSPELWTSTYGWEADEARDHCRSAPEGYSRPERFGGCSWTLPEQVNITEVTYSEFLDTVAGNRDTVGINAEGMGEGISCACGKYENVTLRYEASLGEILSDILGLTRTSMTV